jgi:predicted GNAT superfamily acetyltransferase
VTAPPFTIRAFADAADYTACIALQRETWGPAFSELVPATVLRIAQDLGGVAAGAFDADGRLLGFVFGMTGLMDGGLVHWSDMLAVRADARDRGIGDALKRYQRDALLARGVTEARWTFDPLEARNARLNLSRLGGIARRYLRDYYGDSDSVLHAGLGTDRLLLEWHLGAPRVVDRLGRRTAPPTPDAVLRLPAALEAVGPADVPRPGEPRRPDAAGPVRLAVPARIQQLKAADPGLARAWRAAVRAAFEMLFAEGREARELVPADGVGWYVLERADG